MIGRTNDLKFGTMTKPQAPEQQHRQQVNEQRAHHVTECVVQFGIADRRRSQLQYQDGDGDCKDAIGEHLDPVGAAQLPWMQPQRCGSRRCPIIERHLSNLTIHGPACANAGHRRPRQNAGLHAPTPSRIG
jgi:hypothetical protein